MGQRNAPLEQGLEARFEACVAECERTARVRGIARSFPIQIGTDAASVHVEGTSLVLSGEHIARHLEGCAGVTLFAVTLGMENERALAQAQATSPLDGLMLDACSSSLAEEASICAARTVEELAHEAGYATTKRFSPGYGDLSLDIQPAFLQALQADKLLGIHVGASQLMTPMKSITAIIGLKPLVAERS